MSANIHKKFLNNPLTKRIQHSKKLIRNNNNRIPLLLYVNKPSSIELKKTKYLLERSMKVREFIHKIRKRTKVTRDMGIFLYIKNKLLSPQEEFGKIYDNLKNEDGFLYLTISEMATSG